jgi:hypothetical protein
MNNEQSARAANGNLLRNFRTLVILTDFVGGAGPDVAALLRWIEEYHDYFVRANAELNGSRFHAFAHRSLTITGPDLLKSGQAVAAIEALCGRLGIAANVSVMRRDVLEADSAQLEFLKRPSLSLVVDLSDGEGESDPAALARDVSNLMALGPTVTFVGDLARLRESGITQSPTFNGRFFSFLASKPASTVRWFRKRWARNPCKEYMALYVDPLGDVYPCAGMVGHAPARFGNIEAPFQALVPALEQSVDAVKRLSSSGPAIPASTPFPTDICRIHRDSVHSLQTL